MSKKDTTREKERRSKKSSIRDLTPLQAKYLALRAVGLPPQQAYLAAGGSPKAVTSEPYNLERRIQELGITRVDMLQDGRAAAKKIFADFLGDKETAHVPAVTRLITMQQDRLDPVVTKTEAKHLHAHLVSPEIIAEVNSTFTAMMESAATWGKGLPEFIESRALSLNSA